MQEIINDGFLYPMKKKSSVIKISSIALIIFAMACKPSNEQNAAIISQSAIKKPLMRENKKLVSKEAQEIENYVKRHNWQMEATGSGLRYMIYEHGKGTLAQSGQRAIINYKVSLLDGTECYKTKDKPEQFLIGEDHVETGLHEGITLMHVGDKAIFILPPHLAHGLLGDQDKIPPLSTIVYDVQLISAQ